MKNLCLLILALWFMKPCFTLEDVTTFLNKLPEDSAISAKIVVINSQRSFMGTLSSPYYVYYKAEAEVR